MGESIEGIILSNATTSTSGLICQVAGLVIYILNTGVQQNLWNEVIFHFPLEMILNQWLCFCSYSIHTFPYLYLRTTLQMF